MKKIYEQADGDWTWDTDSLRWTSPRRSTTLPKQIETVEEKKHAEYEDWVRWTEFLFKLFIRCRRSPDWEKIRAHHDDEDQAYFETLEALNKAGRLEVNEYV